MPNATNYKILYADDDADDHYFLKESLTLTGSRADMVSVYDGEEAISYLQRSAAADSLPAVIILDLNMPRLDGKQTLSYLKAHPKFASIPVVILSTSNNKAEKKFCTDKGALSYCVKPCHVNGYNDIIQTVMTYI